MYRMLCLNLLGIKMNRIATIILSAVFFVLTGLQGAELGMKAPALDVKEWLKGGPVALATPPHNKVYVLLFWETGCQHCMTILPEVAMLNARFKDQGLI